MEGLGMVPEWFQSIRNGLREILRDTDLSLSCSIHSLCLSSSCAKNWFLSSSVPFFQNLNRSHGFNVLFNPLRPLQMAKTQVSLWLFCLSGLLGLVSSSERFWGEEGIVRGPPVGSHLYGLSYSIFTSSSTSILKPFILNPHISHLPHCSLVSHTARNLWQPALLSF